MLTGVGALCGWFAQPVPWWIVVPEVALLIAAYWTCFLLVSWWGERRYKNEIWQAQRAIDERIALIRAGMRNRLVYIDGQGNEIRKWEPA